MRTGSRERAVVFGFLLAYFILNLLFLTRYPLVHSDESWLAGLTRNMLATGNPGVTEPFFDLKPRYPHAIKILFHLLQMPFILVFGYTVFSVRLLSLLAGVAALYLFYRCCRVSASFPLSLALTALAGFTPQFVAAAHTARQEILLVCLMAGQALTLLQSRGDVTDRLAVRVGLLAGLGAGLHPNGFVLAAGCGAALLLRMIGPKKFRVKPLLLFIGVAGGVALVFIGLSFLFDPQFPAHYMRYGETEFDLFVPVADKLSGFFGYLQRLWYGISGTYTLPDLRSQLVLCALLVVWGAVAAVRTGSPVLRTALGIAAGALAATVLIGRYNQLSAILWMFPCLLLSAPLLAGKKLWRWAAPAVAAVFATATVFSVLPALAYSYDDYLAQISAYVSPESKTLANLNTGFYFTNDALLDVRNLSYLRENDLTFADYVESRGITTILWSDEMDYLYGHRPDYNALYGNPRYVPEAETFLAQRCTLLGTFENDGYAARIAREIGKPHIISVYRVNP